MRYERRSTVSREIRYWESQRMSSRDKAACIAMVFIFIVGLCAVWSVS